MTTKNITGGGTRIVNTRAGNDAINRGNPTLDDLFALIGGDGNDTYSIDGVGRSNVQEVLDADIDTLMLNGVAAKGHLVVNGVPLLKASSTGAAQLKLSSAGSLPTLTPVVERVAVTGGGDVTIEQFAEGTGTVPAGTLFRNTSGKTTFSVNSGTTTIGSMDVQANGGELVFNSTQNLDDLVIGAAGLTKMALNGSRVLVVNTLSIVAGGKLDLTNNDMIVRATATTKNAILTQVEGWIVSGMNGVDSNFFTNWNGTGLISSAARAANLASGYNIVGLGAIRNSDLDIITGVPGSTFTTFDGVPVTVHDILIKHTYFGDGNLDGVVSFDDYVGMDNAFFGLIPILGWATGDINFNDVINFDDYSVVDQAFFAQLAPL